jgi:cobalt-zinc-cadmium efflux system outer membrane protein
MAETPAGLRRWTVLLLFIAAVVSGCAVRTGTRSTATAEGIQKRTGLTMGPPRSGSGLPPGVSLDQPLSIENAAAIALWNNPQFRVDVGALGLAEADLIDAGLLRNPRLDMLMPVGAKPLEILFNMPVDVFWQRPKRIAASQAAYDQLAESLIQNGLNTIRDARFAHSDLVLAKAREDVARRAAKRREQIATITGARLRAGDISELETVSARAEAGIAQEQLVRFQHDVALARERLRFALGLSIDRTAVDARPDQLPTAAPLSLDDLIGKALAARPDLRAAELAIAAATKRAKWERSRLSLVSAQLSSKDVGEHGLLTGPGLSAELPIFHRNQGLIARAEADAEIAIRQYMATKQRIAFEVAEARQQLLQALEALVRTRGQVVEPLLRGTALAEEQYKNGDVAYLFVLEQTRALIDAELRIVDLEGAARRAQAQLQRSVGTQ